LVAGLAAAAVLAGGGAAVVVLTDGPDAPAVAATVSPSPPADPAKAAARTAIETTLGQQSAALLRGDLAGWLAAGEPGNKEVAAELRRRFGSLRAMKVAGFAQTIAIGPGAAKDFDGREEWNVEVKVGHCFVDTDCALDHIAIHTRWRVTPDGARLSRIIGTFSNASARPHPWELAALKAATGRRVVVAGAARGARARSVVAAADRAAAVADRFAGAAKPQRYLIFLASSAEFSRWFGGSNDSPVGLALGVTPSRTDLMLNIDKLRADQVESVLRHELTHAATLRGDDFHQPDDSWWLIEGVAEMGQEYGRAAREYGLDSEIRRYLREGEYKSGDLAKIYGGESEEGWTVWAKYGLAYYAVRRVAERFGQKKLIRFTDEVLQNGTSIEDAAQSVFGVPIANVYKDCLRYTRGVVGG
jgi:hypothetical protein